MKIVIDLDGTICELKSPDQPYEDLKPMPGAVEKIAQMRSQGHYIIIQTARNMGSCESNLGKVMKNVGLVTLEWLKKYAIEYDEIYFGKPNGHVYIDDRALRYETWDGITADVLQKAAEER
jgi:capsule biosynthesis phosphatase